jgi:hypothetical protein
MDEKDFNTMIDGYVESDPREYLKAERKRIDENARTDISDDDFTRIADSPRQRLAARAEMPVKRRDYSRIDALLAEYAADLGAAVGFERRDGFLKPWTAVDALKLWLGPLEVHGWRGAERAAILAMLEPGEEPTAVEFRTTTTNHGRKITRADVRDWALDQRPKWQVDLPDGMRPSEFLAAQGFPTDQKIEELERVAEHVERQQHIRTSGPAHLVGKEYR